MARQPRTLKMIMEAFRSAEEMMGHNSREGENHGLHRSRADTPSPETDAATSWLLNQHPTLYKVFFKDRAQGPIDPVSIKRAVEQMGPARAYEMIMDALDEETRRKRGANFPVSPRVPYRQLKNLGESDIRAVINKVNDILGEGLFDKAQAAEEVPMPTTASTPTEIRRYLRSIPKSTKKIPEGFRVRAEALMKTHVHISTSRDFRWAFGDIREQVRTLAVEAAVKFPDEKTSNGYLAAIRALIEFRRYVDKTPLTNSQQMVVMRAVAGDTIGEIMSAMYGDEISAWPTPNPIDRILDSAVQRLSKSA